MSEENKLYKGIPMTDKERKEWEKAFTDIDEAIQSTIKPTKKREK